MNQLEELQTQLNNIYKKEITIDILNKLEYKDKLSAPFFLNIFQSYVDSNLKIMYIGKETNQWFTHKSISNEKRGVNYLINSYDEAFEKLLERYQKGVKDNDKKSKHAYFRPYINIKKNFTDGNVGSILWNNLLKFDYDQGKGYSKNSNKHPGVVDISKKIFLKELEILKPNILIFVTGSTYDEIIRDFLNGYETIKIIIPKKLWKFKYKDMICYRTIHPDSIRWEKKGKKKDYFQMIIDDIKKDNKT